VTRLLLRPAFLFAIFLTSSACKTASVADETKGSSTSSAADYGTTSTKGCGESFDPSSVPHLNVNFADDFVSRTITFELNIAANQVTRAIQYTALEKFLPATAKVPGVTGTKMLVGDQFGPDGSRRLVCLSDQGTAAEEVIDNRTDHEFRYKVWNYSSEVAKPIHYAVGEFVATPIDTNRSSVKWTYSFTLKPNVFPGNLGAPGRFLFRKSFVDGDYADFMASGARAMQQFLELPN
jgi:hypothetical protein